jgi:hypothetical protein
MPVRLPSAAAPDPAENRGHALLSLLAIVAVGFGLWTTGALAQHWGEVVASVQRLVGGW